MHGMRGRARLAAAVAVGGAMGGLLRAALEDARPASGGWPWATFLANVAGVVLLAWAATRLGERLRPMAHARPLIGTGVCGGLTTFSALQLEAVDLIRGGRAALAVAYLAGSLAAGLVLAFATVRLSRRARWRA
jgi:CrcB protein